MYEEVDLPQCANILNIGIHQTTLKASEKLNKEGYIQEEAVSKGDVREGFNILKPLVVVSPTIQGDDFNKIIFTVI